MFRRATSTLPMALRAVRMRNFSEMQPLHSKEHSKSKANILIKGSVYALTFVLVGTNVIFNFYINKVLTAREYVTEADLEEYRSQPRNALEGKTDSQVRDYFMTLGAREIDQVLLKTMTARKKTMNDELKASCDKKGSEAFWKFFWANMSFTEAVRNENLDDYVRFYFTYLEREEESRRKADKAACSGDDFNPPVINTEKN